MIKFSKKELEALYREHKSVRAIGKKLGIPKSTLGYHFKKFNIKVLKDNIKKSDILQVLKEVGSVYKVAEILGVSPGSLYYFIDKYSIDITKYRFPYTKEQLIQLHDKFGSITKVASELSKNYSTVRHWYKEYNIVVNESGMNIFQELRNTPMTEVQKSALIGSMLGDGGMWLAPHSKNARLYVCHCEKQLGYLKWVRDIFNPFSRPIKQTEKAGKKLICGRYVNGSNFYRFYTIAHPDVTDIYKLYYRKNLKGLDESIIDRVNLLAMAIWFADDGNILRNRRGEPVSCSIATCSFTYTEHLILVEVLRKFFNGNIKISEHGGKHKGKDREDFILNMSGKEHITVFLDMIKTILPKCIHYKLS